MENKLNPPPEFYDILMKQMDQVVHAKTTTINQQLVALLCGTHPRCGTKSPVSIIGCLGVRQVVEIIKDARRTEEQNARFDAFKNHIIEKIDIKSTDEAETFSMIMRRGLRQCGYEPLSNPHWEKLLQYCYEYFETDKSVLEELRQSINLIYNEKPKLTTPF